MFEIRNFPELLTMAGTTTRERTVVNIVLLVTEDAVLAHAFQATLGGAMALLALQRIVHSR